MGICPDMSHRPEIKTEHVKREHVDDAVRALACESACKSDPLGWVMII
jgi:hypothetical protein